MRWRAYPFFLVLLANSACQSLGSVQLTEVATAAGKPSNVATLVRVTQHGQPVSSLTSSAFRLIEDGQSLENQSVELRLLQADKVAAFHTVLLLDLGHATTREDRQQFGEAVGYFLRSVRGRQPVTVVGFDGSTKVRLLGDFPVDSSGASQDNLDKQMPGKLDPSRNLLGSIKQGLDLLDERLKKSNRALGFGTLVVFARGPDVAGRITRSDFAVRLSHSKHRMVFVNVAGDSEDSESPALAKDGRIQAQAVESLPIAFEQAGALVDKLLGQYYLLSYCSPARSGERRLGVEVQVVSDDLQVETGSLETKFDANGFASGCSSMNPPRFGSGQEP